MEEWQKMIEYIEKNEGKFVIVFKIYTIRLKEILLKMAVMSA